MAAEGRAQAGKGGLFLKEICENSKKGSLLRFVGRRREGCGKKNV